MTAPRVVTLGCRLNTLESEMIRDGALAAGLEDTIIVNTCAVTSEAERQARQSIRKLARENPSARIIVTGCAAQLSPQTFADMDEVTRVLGNAEKLDANLLADDGAEIVVSDIMDATTIEAPMISGISERTRAFVQVQQGCDHRCTFCIIPFARGRNRSVAPARIVEQVRTLVATGHGEVVLTGVDVSSYGHDAAGVPALGQLARQILDQVPGLLRLRITSLDPAAIDDGIFELLAHEPRFMPHLHLSLQAADDMVLKRMKRRHSRDDAKAVIERARAARPDAVFGADLIAGFPTETDAMFENTLAAIEEFGLTYLHVFPYSPRPGTAAEKMPRVPGERVKERAARLRAAGDKQMQQYLMSRVGGLAQVLIERDHRGMSEHFAPVELTFDAPIGAIVEARIEAADLKQGRLIAGLAA
ncbi:MAG: tRNA (N(6)-L-threonylcarbamoyladenosine(37)-C(2))-methylthiotransferase MtaB [Rhodospirillaceae bacterium]|nr:tRNA (N(6)-L-threonylcarbamoyladenosine(37)-C(2))-methylthiotransferase MtaB [Rhodospirillaceae bacterium]